MRCDVHQGDQWWLLFAAELVLRKACFFQLARLLLVTSVVLVRGVLLKEGCSSCSSSTSSEFFWYARAYLRVKCPAGSALAFSSGLGLRDVLLRFAVPPFVASRPSNESNHPPALFAPSPFSNQTNRETIERCIYSSRYYTALPPTRATVTLLASDVWHRISLVVLPLGQAAIVRHAIAFRCALLLRVEAIGAPDAVGFRRRSRGVLVRVDRAKRAVVHTSAFFVRPVRSSRALLSIGVRTGWGQSNY